VLRARHTVRPYADSGEPLSRRIGAPAARPDQHRGAQCPPGSALGRLTPARIPRTTRSRLVTPVPPDWGGRCPPGSGLGRLLPARIRIGAPDARPDPA
jgi:hypothetical protein